MNKENQPLTGIQTHGTRRIQLHAQAETVEVKVTTRRRFQNAMRKQRNGFCLYEPFPCRCGNNGGSWSVEDSEGLFWQQNTGSPYDTYSYLQGECRKAAWEEIANGEGYSLDDVAPKETPDEVIHRQIAETSRKLDELRRKLAQPHPRRVH